MASWRKFWNKGIFRTCYWIQGAPSIEFQEVDFSANKFMTDLIEERTAPSVKLEQRRQENGKKRTQKTDAPTALPQKLPGVEEGIVPEPVSAKSPPIAPKKD